MYSLRDFQAGLSKITKIIEDYIDVRNNIRRLATFASCAFASRTFASRAFVFRAFASRAFASRAFASRAFASRRPRPKPEEEHAMSSQQSYFHVISTIILPCMQIVPTRWDVLSRARKFRERIVVARPKALQRSLFPSWLVAANSYYRSIPFCRRQNQNH